MGNCICVVGDRIVPVEGASSETIQVIAKTCEQEGLERMEGENEWKIPEDKNPGPVAAKVGGKVFAKLKESGNQ